MTTGGTASTPKTSTAASSHSPLARSAIAVAPDGGTRIHMPSPSYYPLVVAAGLPCLAYAAVFTEILWVIPGLVLLLFGTYAWGLEPSTEPAAR